MTTQPHASPRAQFEALRIALATAPTYETHLSAINDMIDFMQDWWREFAAALPADTAPATSRAEFEALCDKLERIWRDKSPARVETMTAIINVSHEITLLAVKHRALIAAALPADTAPQADDERPRADGNEE